MCPKSYPHKRKGKKPQNNIKLEREKLVVNWEGNVEQEAYPLKKKVREVISPSN